MSSNHLYIPPSAFAILGLSRHPSVPMPNIAQLVSIEEAKGGKSVRRMLKKVMRQRCLMRLNLLAVLGLFGNIKNPRIGRNRRGGGARSSLQGPARHWASVVLLMSLKDHGRHILNHKFITLLEYAEEVLHCSDIIVCLKKDRPDRRNQIYARRISSSDVKHVDERPPFQITSSEKVEIMSDRLLELYRAHGLDALHDLFANLDHLGLTLGKEDEWQAFIRTFSEPKRTIASYPSEKMVVWSLAAVVTSIMVFGSPFGYRFVKKSFLKRDRSQIDSEINGAESASDILVERIKRRSRRRIYCPMLPILYLQTDQATITDYQLAEAKEKLKTRVKREEAIRIKHEKLWERRYPYRTPIGDTDEDLEEADKEEKFTKARAKKEKLTRFKSMGRLKIQSDRIRMFINPRRLKRFWNGHFLKKRKNA
ncbi:unnamed protein product [Nesidiocoris tenuis]|uniref:Uncharacterized protein n=1 Tax=Nesidiocoris tenuis TaxID=355587 RepID=A0A6H5H0I1_9HEMI|nr:unnamed protein product [Nesidiocoris tenuis]